MMIVKLQSVKNALLAYTKIKLAKVGVAIVLTDIIALPKKLTQYH